MTIPKTIQSYTNKIYLKFISDARNSGSGFKIHFENAANGCGGHLTAFRGSINYQKNNQITNIICVWSIHVNEGSRISITFDEIDIESSNQCNNDYIEVFDGLDASGLRIEKLCESNYSKSIESISNNMLIRSNFGINSIGLSLHYGIRCNTTLKYSLGVIESPNYPNSYPQKCNCLWIINAPQRHTVAFEFEYFETTEYDCLTILSIDENDKELSEQLGPYCGVYLNNITTKYNLVSIM